MTESASPLLSALILGAFFAGSFLFLLFMLWASGRSPTVRRTGQVVVNLFYLVGVLAQAWMHRGDERAMLWQGLSALLVASLALNLFRLFKTRAHGDGVGPPTGSIAP